MSDILRPPFGRNGHPYPPTWDDDPELAGLFAEHLTTPEELHADMRFGIQSALSNVEDCFEAAGIPIYSGIQFRADEKAERIRITADGHSEGVIARYVDDLSSMKKSSLVLIDTNPRAVFQLTDGLLHVTYAGDDDGRTFTRRAAAEALTFIGIGMHLSQRAGRHCDIQVRRDKVLSIAANHDIDTSGSLADYPTYEELVGAMLGGTLYNSWLIHFIDHNYRGSDEELQRLHRDLTSIEQWSEPTKLNLALTHKLEEDEVLKLLSTYKEQPEAVL